MDRLLRSALALYLVATSLGVVLRYGLVRPLDGVVFGNALHAHSHTLYGGWAALVLFALMFERAGADDRAVRLSLWSVILVGVANFVAFLHSGYGAPGIVVSAVSLVSWGSVVVLLFRRLAPVRTIDGTFFRVALVYVALAGLGAMSRVGVMAAKVTDPLPGDLAVFAFLNDFGAFFLFALMGLLVRFFEASGAPLERRLLRWQLGWMVPLSAFTFPLGVVGGMDSVLGPPARLAALLLAIPNALWLVNVGRALPRLERGPRLVLGTVWLAWGTKAALEVVGALGLAEAATLARHPAILYLHVELLGVLTATLLFLLRRRAGLTSAGPVLLHQAGVALMVTGLALASAPGLLGWVAPAQPGLWLALSGGVLVVLAGVGIAGQLATRSAGRPLP